MSAEHLFNKDPRKPTILVAPLEWGLGHATRCIPIINQLLTLDCQVIIAAEGNTDALLRAEFPKLQFLPLRGYRMKYSRKKFYLLARLFTQIPKVLYTIYQEHRWLQEVVNNYKVDAVISDNRFGLYHKSITSIYITHQIQIKTGSRLGDLLAAKVHRFFIKKYDQCWIPDFKEPPGIAGDLSHPLELVANAYYIGCLSRFQSSAENLKKYDIVFSISGPEPQRSVFEALLLKESNGISGKILLIRGTPGGNVPLLNSGKNIDVVDHLTAAEMNIALQSAGLLVSRSGYTSIMDYIKLRVTAILVPTPGQKEQEYLAKILSANGLFVSCEQEKFSLQKMIKQAGQLQKRNTIYDMEQYKEVVNEFVRSLT